MEQLLLVAYRSALFYFILLSQNVGEHERGLERLMRPSNPMGRSKQGGGGGGALTSAPGQFP